MITSLHDRVPKKNPFERAKVNKEGRGEEKEKETTGMVFYGVIELDLLTGLLIKFIVTMT